MTQEVLKLALEALEANYLLVNGTETHGGLEQCLDGYYSGCFNTDPINKQTEEAIAAIKQALAHEQEPVAYDKTEMNGFVQDLYDKKMQEGRHGHYETMFHVVHQAIKRATPPQRTPLTEDEIEELFQTASDADEEVHIRFARAIESKLKEFNT